MRVERFRVRIPRQAYVYTLTPLSIADKREIAAGLLVRKREDYKAFRLEIEELGAELGGNLSAADVAADVHSGC